MKSSKELKSSYSIDLDKAEKQLDKCVKIVKDIKKDGYCHLSISHIDHDIAGFIFRSLKDLGYKVKKRTDLWGNFHLDFYLGEDNKICLNCEGTTFFTKKVRDVQEVDGQVFNVSFIADVCDDCGSRNLPDVQVKEPERNKSYMEVMNEMDELEKVEIPDELAASLKKYFGLDKGDEMTKYCEVDSDYPHEISTPPKLEGQTIPVEVRSSSGRKEETKLKKLLPASIVREQTHNNSKSSSNLDKVIEGVQEASSNGVYSCQVEVTRYAGIEDFLQNLREEGYKVEVEPKNESLILLISWE